MGLKSKISGNERNLLRRYLIWCYKTTKENVDRIDRYYTQNLVDHFILDELTKTKEFKSDKTPIEYKRLIKSFEDYAENKVKNADQQKFVNEKKTELTANYLYQTHRFAAIEKAIKHFFGAKELESIKNFYEEEMTSRILQAKDHT